jgi:hypothetical protein
MRVVPEALEESYQRIINAWTKLSDELLEP